jgi:hypothetical protein
VTYLQHRFDPPLASGFSIDTNFVAFSNAHISTTREPRHYAIPSTIFFVCDLVSFNVRLSQRKELAMIHHHSEAFGGSHKLPTIIVFEYVDIL